MRLDERLLATALPATFVAVRAPWDPVWRTDLAISSWGNVGRGLSSLALGENSRARFLASVEAILDLE